MNDSVLDASLTLQWLLEDEADRKYSLAVLASLSERRALVPILWFYEVGNGLLMALRRNRIAWQQIERFLALLQKLPIYAAQQSPGEILELPRFARAQGLTTYDAAYLDLAARFAVPLATTDAKLRAAAASAGVNIVAR